ncbi:ABC transporter permease [Subtercola vilae]|uniref:ABC transporter permease n=1 Tax=Subtercola vilae TaxID=2056433 RepID=A0A4T2BDB5_9MICO|nr:ABC transporter permease [Subtercola vilae]TIH27058.1 ABC transporter permease [Subtercola vilae]
MSRVSLGLLLDLVWSATRISLRSFDVTRSWRTLLVALGIGPCLQVVYLVGMSGTTQSDAARIRVAIAAALLSAAIAAVESTSIVLATSRYDGALAPVMLSTLPAFLVWVGQIIAATVVGAAAGLIGVGFTSLFFFGSGTSFPIVGSLVAVIVTSISTAGFGFAVGALSLQLRDSLLPASITVSVMFVLCGVVTPLSNYWGPFQIIANVVPLTQSTEAIDFLLRGDLASYAIRLGIALLIGVAWTVIGSIGWKMLDRRSRRSGSMELL